VGELDKFSGKGVTTTATTGSSVAKPGAGLPAWAKTDSKPSSTAAEEILRGASARFAIALDATGSMSGLIDMAKKSITEILRRVIAGAGRPVEIMLVVYRDYDVPNEIVEASTVTKDANALTAWLNTVRAHGGGSNDGEAVERALETIHNAGRFEAVMIAGDEPPNDRRFLQTAGRGESPLAEDFARRFAQANTPIHTFVVGDDIRTVQAFTSLASLSGGKSGRLDGSAEMIDMAVMAMLAKLKGSEGVKAYMRDYHVGSRAAKFGQMLLEGPKK
jgi:hypothetical protein